MVTNSIIRFGNLEWATYSENTSHAIKTGLNQFRGLKRKVNQYDLDKKFIKTWDSIADAQRFYNTSQPNISKVLKGERHYAGQDSTGAKLQWEWYGDWLLSSL